VRRLVQAAARAGAGLALAACASSNLNPFSGELTIEQEKEIGADLHRQIRDVANLVTDPVLVGYLDELGQSLVRVTEPQPFIYRFNLIDDDSLNAFAVPGGYIYLHTGVLQQVGNVSELMGVLSHEVAHVRRRHIADSRKKEGPAQLAVLIAGLGAVLAGADPSALVVASGVNVALQLKHSREHEADADRQGISYMIDTGYDPRGMVEFFQRIQAASGGGANEIPPYLFSHPEIPERIRAGKVEIERVEKPAGLVSDDPRLAAMQARLATLADAVAGGTGLKARADFDPGIAKPYLDRTIDLLAEHRLDDADETLARASRLAPRDPRIPLARADLAERRGHAADAVEHLTRAVELDPAVPLAQYRLGLAHKRLGNRQKAVFYLELAAETFAAKSSGRRRADLEIDLLTFQLLDQSGLSDRRAGSTRERFARGEPVVWWGEVAQRFVSHLPRFEVRWRDPGGEIAYEETVPMGSLRRVTARFDTKEAATGDWRVDLAVAQRDLDARSFQIAEPGG
jgi:predicted Zn-dependent protease